MDQTEKSNEIAHHMRAILEILGLDQGDRALKRTPERVAKLYLEELFSTVGEKEFPTIPLEKEEGSSEQLIILRKIRIRSICAHHFLPMMGTLDVAYRPYEDRVIGFSHIERIAYHYAQRPQLQERLSHQIMEALMRILMTKNVAVRMRLHHCCMSMRNNGEGQSEVETLLLRGDWTTDPF